ncbi:hypothetical protein [Dongshaea marina]|uniref:hypothetical protein n=1 Tax=Dongshaea marina TaxID=2047966 RepID=UPI000D3E8626|nr:hypothetical protein [Dongshaea marina]
MSIANPLYGQPLDIWENKVLPIEWRIQHNHTGWTADIGDYVQLTAGEHQLSLHVRITNLWGDNSITGVIEDFDNCLHPENKSYSDLITREMKELIEYDKECKISLLGYTLGEKISFNMAHIKGPVCRGDISIFQD